MILSVDKVVFDETIPDDVFAFVPPRNTTAEIVS
jgi:outer membrane lipoprotein-sorting protein